MRTLSVASTASLRIADIRTMMLDDPSPRSSRDVKVTNTGERADGSAINASYTAKYDGSAAAVTGTGSPYDSISIKQVNANTLTYAAKQTSGKYHASGRTVVSSDGKTMTSTSKGTDANGAAMTLKLVYEKQ